MKTFLSLATFAAVTAFLFFQLSLVVAMSLLFAAGFAAIVIADYTPRRARVITLTPAAGSAVLSSRERLGLAA